MARRYAEDTTVPPSRSQEEIKKLLRRIDADQFFFAEDRERIMCAFRARGRQVRLELLLPDDNPKTERMLWRHLVLYVKARVTEIQEGILNFDEAFLPHLMLPDGRTFKQLAIPAITESYETGQVPSLMPGTGV